MSKTKKRKTEGKNRNHTHNGMKKKCLAIYFNFILVGFPFGLVIRWAEQREILKYSRLSIFFFFFFFLHTSELWREKREPKRETSVSDQKTKVVEAKGMTVVMTNDSGWQKWLRSRM